MSLLLGAPQDWEELEIAFASLQTWLGKQEGVNTALQTQTGAIAAVPTGAIVAWSTSTAPTGFLLCNGAAVDRTAYATLFSVIGVAYGSGDGTSTFNVPDLRGKFPLGVAASGTGSTLAGTGGSLDHTHSISSDGSHDHGGETGFVSGSLDFAGTGSPTLATFGHSHTISSGGSHTHTGATGSGNPAFLAVNYIIRT